MEEDLVKIILLECNLIEKNLAGLEGEIFEYDGGKEYGSLKIDLVINSELAVLGFGRDTERQIQHWRKKQGFKPGEIVSIYWQLEYTENLDIYEEVTKTIDWGKLNMEIKFLDKIEQDQLTDADIIEIKDFAKIRIKQR
jgi:hypothetical protein